MTVLGQTHQDVKLSQLSVAELLPRLASALVETQLMSYPAVTKCKDLLTPPTHHSGHIPSRSPAERRIRS